MAATASPVVLAPQEGPQEQFLATPADIAIYGGAAGGGKSWALLLEPLRHIHNPRFGAVIFRRSSVQIRSEGSLWDESVQIYSPHGASPKAHDLWWKFPSGGSVSFAHLEHDKTVLDWHGSQIPLLCFDELTSFTEAQFWYMTSRNRSMCGVRPYLRATCNPDVDSWVAQLIAWWINQDTGYAIPERAGVLRWFVRIGDELKWADDPAELGGHVNPLDGAPIRPKSLTFISSKLTDNKALMAADPGYMSTLMGLPVVERERLLNGNWKIRWSGQTFFEPDRWLENGRPVAYPPHCDTVFAVINSALKSGLAHDGTGVVYCARNMFVGHPLIILDWELHQIDGAALEDWLPGVFTRLEALARECKARAGVGGIWIEDKNSGTVLLQQASKKRMNVHAINSKLTALGKDERAMAVVGHYNAGKMKISEHAYDKVVVFKGVARNHLVGQVTGFQIADPNAHKRADDLLDCATYALALTFGNNKGL